MSEFSLPDLQRRRAGPPDWILRIGRKPPASPEVFVAELPLQPFPVRLWRTDGGVRLEYEPVGSFAIAASGTEITWFPAQAPVPEHVAAVVLGPVLALALHAQGTVCLHGSAVRLGAQGLAFVAPKRFGKSTLTSALVEAGAELISDDTLAVEFNPMPVLQPGVHSLKLWGDSMERLAPSLPSRSSGGVKPVLTGFPARARRTRPTRLSAVYLLRPVAAVKGAEIGRERLSPMAAVLSLVANAKIGDLLAPIDAAALLRTASELAKRVPVYELTIPRNWDLLPLLVRTLSGWHPAPPRPGRVLQEAG